MATAVDLFPPDIIEDILARLPVKPLLRCKAVSKTFNSIISNLHFIVNLHLKRSLSTNQLIAINHGTHVICTTVGSAATASTTTRFSLSQFFSRPLEVSIAGSCHGFLAISDYERGHLCSELKVILLNPSTLSHLVVPRPVFSADSYSSLCLGFGYDSFSNDYKVLLIVFKDVDNVVVNSDKVRTTMVYSFKHNRWGDGRADVVDQDDCFFGKGAFIEEDYCRLHWLCWGRAPANGGKQPILCFDLCTEEWSDLGVVEDMLEGGVHCVHFGDLGVFDGCLCLSRHVYPDYVCCDVWVRKEYGVVESWTRLFRFCGEADIARCPPLGYSKGGGEFLVVLRMERRNGLYWYNPKEDSIREADEIPGYCWFRDAAPCAGSLVTFPMLKSMLESNGDQKEQSQNLTM